MKKTLYVVLSCVMILGLLCACGKKKSDEETTAADPMVETRDEIVNFVDVSFPSIRGDWDNAVDLYNTYFTSDDIDATQFAKDLKETAIPQVERFISNLSAIDLSSSEAQEIQNLYLQAATKQKDAMMSVADAIEQENAELLEQAESYISEANTYLSECDSKLNAAAATYGFTVNGSLTSQPVASSSDAE